ncbi:hypothetical protein EMIT0P218_70272 [Pseudomonas sp. IT-P218]
MLRPGMRVFKFNTGNDERVIGILTTGPEPIFLQCDN